jgi:tRNA (cmo5U34)-methyltransferase
VTLLPFESSEAIRLLDLGAGTGALTLELLSRFPNASVTCADFSEEMLSHAREQLAKYGEKITFMQSDLRKAGWSQGIQGSFDAVVSSFLTHTILDSVERVYPEVYGIVNAGGCFLSGDFYSSPGPMFDKIYHRLVLQDFQARIKQQTGAEKSLEEVHMLLQERRKKYRAFHTETEEAPIKLTVKTHLALLEKAGFDEVDCLVKYRNNAIIGGLRHQ